MGHAIAALLAARPSEPVSCILGACVLWQVEFVTEDLLSTRYARQHQLQQQLQQQQLGLLLPLLALASNSEPQTNLCRKCSTASSGRSNGLLML